MLEAYNKDRTKQKAQVIKEMTGRTKNYVRRKELYKRENRKGNF